MNLRLNLVSSRISRKFGRFTFALGIPIHVDRKDRGLARGKVVTTKIKSTQIPEIMLR